jgi:hypothetical protein
MATKIPDCRLDPASMKDPRLITAAESFDHPRAPGMLRSKTAEGSIDFERSIPA